MFKNQALNRLFCVILLGLWTQESWSYFSLSKGFTQEFHQCFKDLRNKTRVKMAIYALLNWTYAEVIRSAGYRLPFSLNCTVCVGNEVKKIDCETQFNDLAPSESNHCHHQPSLLDWESRSLGEHSLLKTRMLVGVPKRPSMEAQYWLFHQETRSKSIAETASQSISEAISWTETETEATSQSKTHSKIPVPPMNGLLAAWPASSGVYADAVNQVGRYTVSDGVVTDTLTQIQWEQVAGTTPMNFSSVANYCASRTTGGFTDWRAPNIVELGTLVDYTSFVQPGMNLTVFPEAPTINFWSGSVAMGRLGYSWHIDWAGYGRTLQQRVSRSYPIRCARSSYPIRSNLRYVVGTGSSMDTVTDSVTGLIWQRVSPSTGGPVGMGRYNQSSASSYCSDLNLGGFSSAWRLPTIRELQTLMNYSKNYSTTMIDETVFEGSFLNSFWSSSPVAANPTSAWLISFNDAQVMDGILTNVVNVLCVHNPGPPDVGLLAVWPASSGVYENSVNQANRYTVSNEVVTDALTQIQWEQVAGTTPMNFSSVASYCASRTTGGYNDWRAPNIVELETLVDYNAPAIGPYLSAFFIGTITGDFWSASADIGRAGNSWYVAFTAWPYRAMGQPQTTNSLVRCARSFYPTPSDKFRYAVAADNSTVTDVVTGLIWERTPPDRSYSLASANRCSDLSLGGFTSGWRLATPRELQTLVDYSKNSTLSPRLDKIFGELLRDSWTSAYSSQGAWGVSLYFGSIVAYSSGSTLGVRCVHNPRSPDVVGLLSAWPASSGVYEDATNQTNRYNITNGTVFDALTGVRWEQVPSTSMMNFTQAQSYCTERSTGGYSAWRLPNVVELGTLRDYTRLREPFLDTTAFPGASSSSFWSASPFDAGNSEKYWIVEFAGYGTTTYASNSTAKKVRCVRSSYPTPPSFRYIVGVGTSIGIITDNVTGLIWQKVAPVSASYIQSNATSYCKNLSLGGFSSGWRLPSARELQTLVDYSISPGRLKMDPVFAGESMFIFLSSTLLAGSSPNPWYVYFGYGYVTYDSVPSTGKVRCVRSPLDLSVVPYPW